MAKQMAKKNGTALGHLCGTHLCGTHLCHLVRVGNWRQNGTHMGGYERERAEGSAGYSAH
eukprot:358883-Chlamydomonas_euryale.AAC.1